MRKVVLYIATSIDGFIADERGGIDWLDSGVEAVEEDRNYERFYQEVDTVIMGRTTYDQVVTELSPEVYPYEDAQSYVMTNRLGDNQEHLTFRNGSVVDLVKELRKTEGKDIWIVGGSSVITPLVEVDLIDEYQIATLPVVLGSGIPLVKQLKQRRKLLPVSVAMKNGIMYSIFRKP